MGRCTVAPLIVFTIYLANLRAFQSSKIVLPNNLIVNHTGWLANDQILLFFKDIPVGVPANSTAKN